MAVDDMKLELILHDPASFLFHLFANRELDDHCSRPRPTHGRAHAIKVICMCIAARSTL